ncbi:MAG: RNA polymerase sigma factor [Deltaproteobacteria bacterium]|nr:RNA polymerase sigma factor [Deltaproteobacteria bacterium]
MDADLRAQALVLLERHARSLNRLVASYARTASDRDDLLQEIALAFWQALPSFRGECSEKTFLLRVAHNRALTFAARRGAVVRGADPIEDHEDAVVATTGKNPAIAYERGERASRLLAAVRALSVPHRQVLTLVLEGLSHKEIAEVLGTNENAVGVRANRARAALRVLLEGEVR